MEKFSKTSSIASKHGFYGVHVLGEMHGIDSILLNDADFLEKHLKLGIQKSGATLCQLQVQVFEPSGLTILALLAESHASIHTYPEYGSLFFDAFTCGDQCVPQEIGDILAQVLKAEKYVYEMIKRGIP